MSYISFLKNFDEKVKIVGKVIEWFLKKAFPIILELLKVYGEEIVRGLTKVIFTYMAEREKKKAEDHLNSAKESFAKAEKAETEEVKNKHLFEYEFYKKQAELKSNEINELAKDFANIEQKTVKLVAEATSKMKAEDLFDLNKKNQSIELTSKENYTGIETATDISNLK